MALGRLISGDYEGCNPLLVVVLAGAVGSTAVLLPAITIPLEVDLLAAHSRQNKDDKGIGVRLE